MLQKFFALPLRLKIELVFYPFFLLYRMPVAWAKSLWEARILLQGRWSRYMGFHPENAINNLFYRTQWINLDRDFTTYATAFPQPISHGSLASGRCHGLIVVKVRIHEHRRQRGKV